MQKKNGTGIGFIFCVVLTCLFWSTGSYGQDYPKGPVQMTLPFAPGGATDILWRSIGDTLARNINGTVSFVLVNKTGGGGVVGTSFVVNSKPDGYTLVSANSDPLNIAPVFTRDVPYNPERDFTYLAKLALFPGSIATRAERPVPRHLRSLLPLPGPIPKS